MNAHVPTGRRFAIDEASGAPVRDALQMILAQRGQVPPMYRVLAHSPATAVQVEALSASLWRGALPSPVAESVFLLVARRWQCDEQWRRHEPKARAAGVPDAALDALAAGGLPLAPENVRVACELTYLLLDGSTVPDPAYRRALAALGNDGVAELVAFIGLAAMVAMSIHLLGEPGGR